MAEPRFTDKCKVTVADDNMSATLFIEPPSNGIAYSVEELTQFIKNKGVYGGIVFAALDFMTKENIYYKDYVVARGTAPKEGSDGYYEMLFDYRTKRTPLIRSDGSVDYQSMREINTVSAGEKIMRYHPSRQGTHGVDVRGRVLRAAPCKELPEIKGTGFDYDEDTGLYTASINGKIEYDGKTIRISEVYEYKGDLDLVTGKIDFKGDVVIKGNVLSGTYIRASKSITVEGSVESATLVAGTDVILKKGMQGGNRARISAGGDVLANFLEFTKVEAKGKIEANIIMNCDINAGTDVIVAGKRGSIIGGTTYAVGMVSSNFIGNVAGHKTDVSVGVTREFKDRLKSLNTRKKVICADIEKLEKDIIELTDTRVAKESKDVRAAKLSQLSRKLERNKNLIQKIQSELDIALETIEVGNNAKVTVASTAYTGVHISVDEFDALLVRDYKGVAFVKNSTDDGLDIIEGQI